MIALLLPMPFTGHGQSRATWPKAIEPPSIRVAADYEVRLGASVTGYAPSITSKRPKSIGFKSPLASNAKGTLHLSSSGCWTRESTPSTPWDSISVVTSSGNAVDGHDADFQLDAHSKMHLVPTGFIDPPGTMGLFVGEGAGWCKLSLDGSQGARTWSNFLRAFEPKPVRRVGAAAIYEGASASGWSVSIKTDPTGTKLYSIEISNSKTMNAVRRIVFDRWTTVEGFTMPTAGSLDYAFTMDRGTEPTETTHAVFKLTNIRSVASHDDPPWIEGMQFRTLVVRHDRPGEIETSSFRLVDGKLFPMSDPGNVFKEVPQASGLIPYAVGGGLLALGIGSILLSRRSRQRAL